MTSEKHNDFNCAQRVHHNTLEVLPFYFVCLLGASIRHPFYASIAGAVWIFGRVIFSLGYYTGNPGNRVPGAILSGPIGLVPLFGMAVSSAFGILGWW